MSQSLKNSAELLTYGCKVNRYESELIKQELKKAGVVFSDNPGVFIINTCTVTAKIDSEISRKIRQLKSEGKKVIITGCLSERKSVPEAFAAADLIIPNASKFSVSSYRGIFESGIIPQTAQGQLILSEFSGQNKAFVKAEDGCNRFCAYCEVPYVRGSEIRSRMPDEIEREVAALSAAGYSEIILTGVNLGLYGFERNEKDALENLIKRLAKVPGLGRLRLSSIGPLETTEGLIRAAADSDGKICPHFHMSLQSGSRKILKLMNRNYTVEQFEEKAALIRRLMPYAALTTDVIAGFPGEGADEFKETLDFIKRTSFTRLHVFPYSDRPDARASSFGGRVDEKEKKERVRILIEEGRLKEEAFIKLNDGLVRQVLPENEKEEGMQAGYTDNYIRVFFEKPPEAGSLISARITGMGGTKAAAEAV